MRRAVNLNRKNDYGLYAEQMMRLISNHKKGDAYKRALIEFRLTDITFIVKLNYLSMASMMN